MSQHICITVTCQCHRFCCRLAGWLDSLLIFSIACFKKKHAASLCVKSCYVTL
jgi:hypothetical protein